MQNIALKMNFHDIVDIDHPEKDSYKIRKAGAQQILISSYKRWAMIHELENEQDELRLEDALQKINTESIDFVIVEGFKTAAIPKIEIHRPTLGKPLISSEDQHVIAIATDEPNKVNSELPILDLNQPEMIATYIEQFIDSHRE